MRDLTDNDLGVLVDLHEKIEWSLKCFQWFLASPASVFLRSSLAKNLLTKKQNQIRKTCWISSMPKSKLKRFQNYACVASQDIVTIIEMYYKVEYDDFDEDSEMFDLDVMFFTEWLSPPHNF